jgi:type VI secretion system protein VasG
MLKSIIRLQLGRVQKRVRENHQVDFAYDDSVVNLIASRCTELESGGRMVDAILTQTLLPQISREFLQRLMEGAPIERVAVTAKDGAFAYDFAAPAAATMPAAAPVPTPEPASEPEPASV